MIQDDGDPHLVIAEKPPLSPLGREVFDFANMMAKAYQPITGGCAVHGKNFRSREAYEAHMRDKHPEAKK